MAASRAAKKVAPRRNNLGKGRTVSDTVRLVVREAVKADYEAGVLSLRAITTKHGVPERRYLEWAREEAWINNDLRPNQNTGRPRKDGTIKPPTPPLSPETRRELTMPMNPAYAALTDLRRETQYDVVLSHRQDLAACRKIAQQQLGELQMSQVLSEHIMLVQQIVTTDIREPRQLHEARVAIEKILALPMRSQTLRNIVDTFARLQDGERRAIGLKDGDAPLDPETVGQERAKAHRVEFVYSNRAPDAGDAAADRAFTD